MVHTTIASGPPRSAIVNAPTPTQAERPANAYSVASVPVPITSVDDACELRSTTMLEPLDRVLGGGLVTGSVVLIAGDPGAGKSSLTAAALRGLVTDRPVLYATGEESIAQAAMRARRLKATHDHILIVSESNVDAIIAHARALRPSVLVVDSISCLTTDDLGGVAGSVQQVRECGTRLAAFAKATDTATILIGHVTRDGSIAGPRTLDHLVDVVLQLYTSDDFPAYRYLRAHKNRFGDASEVGAFEMTATGLVPSYRDPEGLEDAESIVPVAQELLNRYRELGGVVDEGLRDRIAGRLSCDEAVPS